VQLSRRRGALFAALLCLAPAAEAHAGWVQPAGGYYLKLWDRSLVGEKVYDLSGDAVMLPERYQDHALRLYAEYGATRALTLVLEATPLGYARSGDRSAVYVGPTWLGLRVALVDGAMPFALEVAYGYSAPVGDQLLSSGTVSGRDYLVRPTFEQHLGKAELSLGASVGMMWFRGAAGAVMSSAADIDPALHARLTAGVSTDFGLGASLTGTLHAPTRTPRVVDVLGLGNTRYLGVDLGLSWWVGEHVGVTAGLGLAPSAVSNAATPAISLGLEIRS
jgi:hypothetical protein